MSNPRDQEMPTRRIYVISLLGAAMAGVCILFIFAFIWFQPDQLSMSDRYFPSATASTTPTATATQTSTPTPTPNLTATQKAVQATSTSLAVQTTIAYADSQWNVLMYDDFDSNKNNWGMSSNDEWINIIRRINGVYSWETTSKKGFISRVTADTKAVGDFFLEVETQMIEGKSFSDSGLVFREDSSGNYYYFGIHDDFFIIIVRYNEKWETILDWTRSSAILLDSPNRLTVIGIDSQFTFLINDQLVAMVTNDLIPQGTTGLAIQVHSADDKAIFEFDKYELREP